MTTTNECTLHITFEAQEGAMLRILGLIHRRGFEVTAIDMPSGGEPGMKSATVTMTPKGPGFRAEIMKKQMERLIEVKEVRIVDAIKRRNILNFFRISPSRAEARV